jgi:hypothetical protein
MNRLTKLLSIGGLVAGLALAGIAEAQQPKPPTPAAIALAKELLTLKSASGLYAGAVAGTVQKTRDVLMQSNLNYQKDLNEVAVVVAKNMAGSEKELGDAMAKIFATDFTEQELKDLVAFHKSPLGQKLLAQEPKSIQASMAFIGQWAQSFSEKVNGEFRAEMRKRGKDI